MHTAVLLPGTGSDEVFVRSVFGKPLADAGVALVTPAPVPGRRLAGAHLAALDEAARHGPVLAGGISFGAHLAVEWALRDQDRCAGLLLVLPGWSGEPADAPAAVLARWAAGLVRASGLAGALAVATDGVPGWLAAELTRGWRRHGTGLADSLSVAADRRAPTVDELGALTVPAGIAGCADDPVHPMGVARAWAEALPHAALATVRLADIGSDPEALGRAAVRAWRSASDPP